MQGFIEWVPVVGFVALLVGSTIAWGDLIKRRNASPGLPRAARSAVPWQFSDLVALGALYLFILSASFSLIAWLLPSGAGLERSLIASILGNVLVLIVAVSWLVKMSGARADDVGLSAGSTRNDVRLGWWMLLLVMPPTMILLQCLAPFFDKRHPIIELLHDRSDWQQVGLVFLAAVVVAPLVEEVLFRVIVQGWLERLWDERFGSRPELLDEDTPRPADERVRVVPIVVASLLFALAHVGHGPDPIPLFFFSLGLGYLYERTHRLGPCWVMHVSLNALSLVMFLMAGP